MARDGSGTYNRAVSPYQSGTVISSTTVNTEMNDVASALTQSLSKDGQTTPTADLPMGGQKHTNVGNASARSHYAATGQAQDDSFIWCGTAGGSANALTLAPTPAITSYAAGQRFRFVAASNNSSTTTVAVSGLAAKNIFLSAACQGGEIVSGDLYEILYDGTQFQLIPLERTDTQPLVVGGTDATKRARLEVDGLTTATTRVLTVQDANGTLAYTSEFAYANLAGTSGRLVLPRGYISGCEISNNSGDANNDIDFAAGQCRDSTNTVNIILAAGLTKQLDNSWAAGTNQGGLDTGVVGNNTYHCFLIRKDSDGTIDALFSLSATSPTMPSGYTYFRRVGSILRVSGANVAFSQFGNEFLRSAPVSDYTTTTLSTTAATPALSVPTGIKVRAKVAMLCSTTGGVVRYVLLTSPDQADTLPTGTLYNGIAGGTSGTYSTAEYFPRTNTSAQVRVRSSGANTTVELVTFGWIDER